MNFLPIYWTPEGYPAKPGINIRWDKYSLLCLRIIIGKYGFYFRIRSKYVKATSRIIYSFDKDVK